MSNLNEFKYNFVRLIPKKLLKVVEKNYFRAEILIAEY